MYNLLIAFMKIGTKILLDTKTDGGSDSTESMVVHHFQFIP